MIGQRMKHKPSDKVSPKFRRKVQVFSQSAKAFLLTSDISLKTSLRPLTQFTKLRQSVDGENKRRMVCHIGQLSCVASVVRINRVVATAKSSNKMLVLRPDCQCQQSVSSDGPRVYYLNFILPFWLFFFLSLLEGLSACLRTKQSQSYNAKS